MKNLKLGFIALCGLLFAFSSCKKNDDNPTPNNSFVIGNTNYATNMGFFKEYNPDYETDIWFANNQLTSNASNINVAWFEFGSRTLPAAGTYTYNAGLQSDTTKNFLGVTVGYNTAYTFSSDDISGGTTFNSGSYDATGSTLTISKSGTTYTCVYNLKFTKNNQTTSINGQYSGTLTSH